MLMLRFGELNFSVLLGDENDNDVGVEVVVDAG